MRSSYKLFTGPSTSCERAEAEKGKKKQKIAQKVSERQQNFPGCGTWDCELYDKSNRIRKKQPKKQQQQKKQTSYFAAGSQFKRKIVQCQFLKTHWHLPWCFAVVTDFLYARKSLDVQSERIRSHPKNLFMFSSTFGFRRQLGVLWWTNFAFRVIARERKKGRPPRNESRVHSYGDREGTILCINIGRSARNSWGEEAVCRDLVTSYCNSIAASLLRMRGEGIKQHETSAFRTSNNRPLRRRFYLALKVVLHAQDDIEMYSQLVGDPYFINKARKTFSKMFDTTWVSQRAMIFVLWLMMEMTQNLKRKGQLNVAIDY